MRWPIQRARVSGDSMAPTYRDGEVIWVRIFVEIKYEIPLGTVVLIERENVGSDYFTGLWRTLLASGRQFNFYRSCISPDYDVLTVRAADLVRLAVDGSRILDLLEDTTEEERENTENQTND